MKFILGKKIEMSQMFDKEGKVIPVTLIEAGPCRVTQIKKKEKDGYNAVQIGFDKGKEKKSNKEGFKFLREFKADSFEGKKGDEIDASVFKEGEKVKVSSFSKGKGFSGGVKKWGFSGKPASHGTKHAEREIGSIGSAFPQRVAKGRKMPGRAGFERVTVLNLKIAKVDAENNLIAVKGAVPGRRGTLVEIKNESSD